MHHRKSLSRLLVAMAALLLGACAQSPARESAPATAAAPEWPPAVGEVALQRRPDTPEADRLDVGLVLFTAGPEDPAGDRLGGRLDKLRRAETRYMPAMLRDVLMQSMAWGAVRVMPEQQPSVELQVTGEILHSDGLQLALRVSARDATGRQWLERIYVDRTAGSDYPVTGDTDPFQGLYHAVANDLLRVREGLEGAELAAIRRVGLLRYARNLAPVAFDGYLERDAGGRLAVARLPAQNDPMLARIERLREHEYLLVDTLDEEYRQLRQEMRPSYNLWRRYGREQILFRQEYHERLAQRDREGRPGSYTAMSQTYNAFRNSKIHEQDLRELAQGFSNEVSPTVLELQGRVYKLSGSLDEQYREWRRILEKIFALETGLPARNDMR